MKRFRFYFDKDAETVWLNNMVHQGWAVKHFFLGMYTFERCEPGEYIYQIDLLESAVGGNAEYETFMYDMGIEVICRWGRWIFLRKKSVEGPFELYTDPASKLTQYRRIRNMFGILAIAELLICSSQVLDRKSVV